MSISAFPLLKSVPGFSFQQMAQDEIHVFFCDLSQLTVHVNAADKLLSEGERARANSFRAPADTRRFTLARAALKRILSGYLHIESSHVKLQFGTYGKPCLPDPETIHFNLSHSGESAMIAVANGTDVGIDVESIRNADYFDTLVATCFSSEERRAYTALEPWRRKEAFYACWTRKEAYVKAMGMGLTIPLRNVETFFPPLSCEEFQPAKKGEWFLSDLKTGEGMAAAISAKGGKKSIAYFSAADIFSDWDGVES